MRHLPQHALMNIMVNEDSLYRFSSFSSRRILVLGSIFNMVFIDFSSFFFSLSCFEASFSDPLHPSQPKSLSNSSPPLQPNPTPSPHNAPHAFNSIKASSSSSSIPNSSSTTLPLASSISTACACKILISSSCIFA
jgi:hypothetical protein